jgi:hypothetical protein
MQPLDKIVLVITYEKLDGEDPDIDVAGVIGVLRDHIDNAELYAGDEDHEEEVCYGFDVVRADVVDADVVEADVS